VQGLDGKTVTAQLAAQAGTDTTRNGGYFTINSFVSSVSPAQIAPGSFSLSVPYPQPATNTATVELNIPQRARVHLKLTNILGQTVTDLLDQSLEAGRYRIGVALRGLAKGVYFLTANDGSHVWTEKVLHFGNDKAFTPFEEGVHRIGDAISVSFKKALSKTQDQRLTLTVSGRSILRKTQTYNLAGNSLNVGDVMVDSAWNVDVKAISTIRYNQPNNQIAGVTLSIDGYTAVTDANGNASVQVPKGNSVRNMDITDPSIWLRQKQIHVNKDTTALEDILTKNDFPDSVMNYLDGVSSRQCSNFGCVLIRFMNPPTFYIVADVTTQFGKDFSRILSTFISGTLNDVTKSVKYPNGFLYTSTVEIGLNPPADGTPGYYVVTTSDSIGNAAALTDPYGAGFPDGLSYLKSAKTVFGTYPQPDLFGIQRVKGHELASGLVYMFRSDSLVSWYNWGPPIESMNPSKTDTLMLRAIFSRDTGWDVYDTDWKRSKKSLPPY
jgi:hypothetical protein